MQCKSLHIIGNPSLVTPPAESELPHGFGGPSSGRTSETRPSPRFEGNRSLDFIAPPGSPIVGVSRSADATISKRPPVRHSKECLSQCLIVRDCSRQRFFSFP